MGVWVGVGGCEWVCGWGWVVVSGCVGGGGGGCVDGWIWVRMWVGVDG